MSITEIIGAVIGALVLAGLFLVPLLWSTRRRVFSRAIVKEYPDIFDTSFDDYVRHKLGEQFSPALIKDILKLEHGQFKNYVKEEIQAANIKYHGAYMGGKMYLWAMQGSRNQMAEEIAAKFPAITKKQAIKFTLFEERYIRRKKLQKLLRLSSQ